MKKRTPFMWLVRDKKYKMSRNLYVNKWEADEARNDYQEVIKVKVEITMPRIRRPFFPKN